MGLIESRWSQETDQVMFRCLAKLYCLESCGWIEAWIDEFVQDAGDRRIGCGDHRKILERQLKRTYGFEYEAHLRPLLISISGLKAICLTEAAMDAGVFAKMVASLNSLKVWRDKHAHSDSVGMQTMLVSPSACRAELENALRGLFALRRHFRRLS